MKKPQASGIEENYNSSRRNFLKKAGLAGLVLAVSPFLLSSNQASASSVDVLGKDSSYPANFSTKFKSDCNSYNQTWLELNGKTYVILGYPVSECHALPFIIAPVEDTVTIYPMSGRNVVTEYKNEKIYRPNEIPSTEFKKIYIPEEIKDTLMVVKGTRKEFDYHSRDKAIKGVVRGNPFNRVKGKLAVTIGGEDYFFMEPFNKHIADSLDLKFMRIKDTEIEENNASRQITLRGKIYRPHLITLDKLETLKTKNSCGPVQQPPTEDYIKYDDDDTDYTRE